MSAPVTSATTPGDWQKANGSSSPLSVSLPSNVVDGDYEIMQCTSDQNNLSTTAVFTPDASWTPHPATLTAIRGGGTGAGSSEQIFYKVASSEASSYSVSRTGGSGNWGITVVRISHPSGTPVLDLTNYAIEAQSGTNKATLNDITTVLADTLALGWATWDEGKTYSAPPSGYSLVSHTANSSNDMAVVQQTQATAGTLISGGDFGLSAATHCATVVIMFTPPSGGTSASVTQVGANVTATTGTQSVAALNAVTISQAGASITASGGTQTIATVNNVSITQVAANITATGGTQAVVTLQTVSITQVGASITATGGVQVVQTNSSIPQSGTNLTATGGTQSVDTINDVSLAQLSATLTLSGGTQVISTVNNSAIPQTVAIVTASGGTQSLTAQVDIAIAQQVANLILTGGTQTVSASSGASSASIAQIGTALVLTGNRQVITTSTGPLPPTRTKSIIFLLDGRIATRIGNNVYMPL